MLTAFRPVQERDCAALLGRDSPLRAAVRVLAERNCGAPLLSTIALVAFICYCGAGRMDRYLIADRRANSQFEHVASEEAVLPTRAAKSSTIPRYRLEVRAIVPDQAREYFKANQLNPEEYVKNRWFPGTRRCKSDGLLIFGRWGVETYVGIQSAKLPSNRSFSAQLLSINVRAVAAPGDAAKARLTR